MADDMSAESSVTSHGSTCGQQCPCSSVSAAVAVAVASSPLWAHPSIDHFLGTVDIYHSSVCLIIIIITFNLHTYRHHHHYYYHTSTMSYAAVAAKNGE